jgi:hypothetical protein
MNKAITIATVLMAAALTGIFSTSAYATEGGDESETNTEQSIKQKNVGSGDSAVHRDLVYLRQQAKESLQKHIHEVVPEEYQKCMVGMKRNLKQTLEIAETTADPRVKLQARAITNDCYRYIMDLCTNAGIVSDALKFVERKRQTLDILKKVDERIEDIEEAKTTNGVF